MLKFSFRAVAVGNNQVTIMRTRQVLAVATLAVLLSACGGGGDSGSQSVSQTVSGTVVKGPMDKAKVVAYKVKADGSLGDKLAETVSAADGSYTLNFKDYTGPVVVEATVTDDTRMQDEATGENIKPAPGFKLRAALNSTGGTVTTQINPLSEVAVVAAGNKAGGFNATNIEQANKDLRESVGFDPMADKPEFDSQGKPKNKPAVAMAAVSSMAASDDMATCAIQTTQATKVKCVVEEVAKKGLNDDTVKAPFVNHAAGVADQAGLPDTAKPVIKQPDGGTPAATPLAQTKGFMGTLRSNAKALEGADLSLQTELQAVASDMQNRLAPFTSSTLDALELATKGAQFWANFQANPSPSFPVVANFSRSNGMGLGGCRLYSDDQYLIEATNKVNALYVACGTSGRLFWDESLKNMVVWSTRVRLHPSSAADQFTVYTQIRRAVYVWNPVRNLYEEPTNKVRMHFGAAFPGNAATLKAGRNAAGDINQVTLTGEMAPAFELTDSNVPPYATTATVLGDKLKVSLNGSWTVDNAGVNTLALQGSVAQYKQVNAVDTLQTELALESGSYIKGSSFNLDTSSAVQPPLELPTVAAVPNDPLAVFDGSHAILLKLRFATAQSALRGQFFMGNFGLDASQSLYSPAKMSFSGSVERKGTPFFEGSVTAEQLNPSVFMANMPTSAQNPQKARLTLVGKVNIPNRMPVSANLTINNTDEGDTGLGTLSGQYRQGAVVINIEGQSSRTPVARSTQLTLTSSEGIKLALDSSKTVHPLTKSGTAVGSFDTTTNRLTYADNTFEQY
ncbi:MAG: hypothetical protein RLZZ352_304 [Pseudomonadota bacterium]|jgi:hypothetical protein